ncbi:hypothetical protein J2Z31_002624 [Sinorhizobium kostiense]|uniref:Uncharacterized protein n=1 Tax=Sinorhizobium kostiense TaxID=76747 RepID=A0ABS4QZP5_9HYPH|nr:hypothetical protein [Sinorhizobium kostiense]
MSSSAVFCCTSCPRLREQKAWPLPRPARHAGSRALGEPGSEGVPRPLRGAHRAFPQAMPGLSSRRQIITIEPSTASPDHRSHTAIGHEEAQHFHRRRIAPFGRQLGPAPGKCAPARPPAPSGRSWIQSSPLSKPESALLSITRAPATPASTVRCSFLDGHHSTPTERHLRPRLSPTRF